MSDLETPSNPPPPGREHEQTNLGLAGNMAKFFIQSPLSPLLYMAMLMLGILGLLMTPRQEDPQISVPMVDLIVQYPGAEPEQVASLAVQPLERIMYEIQGVDHVYSASQRGMGIVTIQFDVGEEMESSLVKVNDKLESNMDRIPPGVQPPLVKAKGIDDVPVVTLTLWSERDYNGDGVFNIRDYADGRHRVTDDRPYGGGSGMVMKPEPLAACLRAVQAERPGRVILLSPRGAVYKQQTAERLAGLHGGHASRECRGRKAAR